MSNIKLTPQTAAAFERIDEALMMKTQDDKDLKIQQLEEENKKLKDTLKALKALLDT